MAVQKPRGPAKTGPAAGNQHLKRPASRMAKARAWVAAKKLERKEKERAAAPAQQPAANATPPSPQKRWLGHALLTAELARTPSRQASSATSPAKWAS